MSILDLFRDAASNIRNGDPTAANSPMMQQAAQSYGQGYGQGYGQQPQQGDVDSTGLRNMGILMMAAGQSMSGADRAKVLAEIPGELDPTKRIYNAAQARLMSTQADAAQQKFQQNQQALANMQNQNFGDDMTDREKAIFKSYVQAGDLTGANDFLAKMSENKAALQNQLIQSPSGTLIPAKMYNEQMSGWQKEYQPDIKYAATAVPILDQIRPLVANMRSGALADLKTQADLVYQLSGGTISPKAINRQEVNAAINQLVVGISSQLSGPKSDKDIEMLRGIFAGGNTDPQAALRILDRLKSTAISNAAIAEHQRQSIGTGSYGAPWTPSSADDIPGPYRDKWVPLGQAPSGGSSSSSPAAAPASQKSYAHLWGG